MGIERLLPSEEAYDLLGVVREIARSELAPAASEAEEAERFPRQTFRLLGEAGLLSLPYPEKYGGADQPFEVYLQVLEELASAWLAVALGISVHVLACNPLAVHGTDEQRERHLGRLLSGDLLGAYCLSEPQAGSDVASMSTRATLTADGYSITGTKAWTSHAGQADFYTVFARTSDDRNHG